MPTPLTSRDLRTRIVAHYQADENTTYRLTAERFSVGEATVSRVLRVHRETGDVMPAPKPRKPRNKIDLEWLREHAVAHPDDRLKDRAEAFEAERGVSVSIAAVHYAMHAIGFTHKKKTIYAKERDSERVKNLRDTFIAQQPTLVPGNLVFLDESGFRLGSPTRYGWARSGQKALGKAVHGAWRNVTMLGAIALNGFRGFMNIESGTSSEVFRAFVESELVPELKPGDWVLMDNLAAHRDARSLDAIRAAGAIVLFLPPYSPEFNPIEKLWSKLKEAVRRQPTDTRECFDDAVANAMRSINSSDLLGWFQHCGYSVAST